MPLREIPMKPLTKAGIVLGLGLGGFFDGIVLHQIFGWHHLVCTTDTCQVETVQALKEQNTQDGFFHLATWILTGIGVAMLFSAARERAQVWAGRTLFGAMLAGWGLFNFVEGVIDHQILGIHHVRPGDPNEFLWDMLFLASGVVLMLAGGAISKSGQKESVDANHPGATYAH
jgi:uncharacterized membrane protein